jgi:hypothetical protein
VGFGSGRMAAGLVISSAGCWLLDRARRISVSPEALVPVRIEQTTELPNEEANQDPFCARRESLLPNPTYFNSDSYRNSATLTPRMVNRRRKCSVSDGFYGICELVHHRVDSSGLASRVTKGDKG